MFAMERIHDSWSIYLEEIKQAEWFQTLQILVQKEREDKIVYPPVELVFNAFTVPFENISVVILGQDPYINALTKLFT